MRLSVIIKSLILCLPGMHSAFANKSTGGTDTAKYCYEVWLKHLTMLWENGLRTLPKTVAELGPGDSIGIGLAALLSGVDKYYALDIVKYSNTERNLLIFDELINLFKKRAGRPAKGWPDYDQYLNAELFPSHILTDEVLNASLSQKRIESIRNALVNMESDHDGINIKYIVPWNDPDVIIKESIDVIFSHSVLEHVNDFESTYNAFSLWLKPKGLMSHQIDFTSHELAEAWNGHWACSQFLWKIITGKRPYLINRQPYSRHISFLKKKGFDIICNLKRERSDGIKRSQLSEQWKDLSDDDLKCSGLFIQARKI